MAGSGGVDARPLTRGGEPARHLLPRHHTGRWATTDAITTLADSNNANPYTYAADNTVNNTDPTGGCSSSDVVQGAIAGGLLVGVVEVTVLLLGGLEVTAGAILGAVFGVAIASAFVYCALD